MFRCVIQFVMPSLHHRHGQLDKTRLSCLVETLWEAENKKTLELPYEMQIVYKTVAGPAVLSSVFTARPHCMQSDPPPSTKTLSAY